MINKIADSVAQALSGVKDGATVLIGGFGTSGNPIELIDGLIAHGARDLTIVNNNAGNAEQACAWLQGLFGPRFPNRPDRVKVGAAASAVAAAIASSPAIAGPSELVGRTHAG